MCKCIDCKWKIGYDSISDCYICGVTDNIEYIDPVWALDEDLGCDMFVSNRNDDATA